MSNFSQRHEVYKFGVILLALSTLVAIWGVVVPGWYVIHLPTDSSTYYYSDLWWTCESSFHECDARDLTWHYPAKFYAIRSLCCLGLFTLLVTSLTVLLKECCARTTSCRHAGIFACLAGTMLLIGCALFRNDPHSNENTSFGPSSYLTLVSGIAAFVAGVAMMVYVSRSRSPRSYATGSGSSSSTSLLRPDPPQYGYDQYPAPSAPPSYGSAPAYQSVNLGQGASMHNYGSPGEGQRGTAYYSANTGQAAVFYSASEQSATYENLPPKYSGP